MRILLFSEVTLVKYNVSTILSPIAGVRHEIRPIRLRYLWSDFRASEEPFSEVYMAKFSLYSKLV